MKVVTNKTTLCHNPQYNDLNFHCHKNLKCHIEQCCLFSTNQLFVLFVGYNMINSRIFFPMGKLVGHSCAESPNPIKRDFLFKEEKYWLIFLLAVSTCYIRPFLKVRQYAIYTCDLGFNVLFV